MTGALARNSKLFSRPRMASLLAASGLLLSAPAVWAQSAPELNAAPAAEVSQGASAIPANERLGYDPLEPFNRASFGFSMGVDRAVIGPVARGYAKVTPTSVQHRVTAVVYNLGEPSTALNDILQGHPKRLGVTSSRFVINSTIGLLGLFDVAAKMGLPAHDADFGQTFGRYGVKAGPYLYVPVMGPLHFREGVGRVLDFATDPVGLVGGGWTSTFGATRLVAQTFDTRANGDNAFRALKDATDPYVTVRSAYGQHRESLVREATGDVQALPDFDDAPPADPASASRPAATQ